MHQSTITVNRTVSLTETEKTLQRLLLDVASYINPKKPSELRITGGWVRDKLLGIQSHDIDVSINDMTGESFGLKMKEYLEAPGNAERYGLYGVATSHENSKSKPMQHKTKVVHGLHKIAKNPDKSKHLETVTTKLLGIDLDLLNLRKETYAAENRTPQMEFGTPEEDALRRDATINALFYNLQTDAVEDFTGHGLEDLENGIIKTPLEPYQTFKDDPLRVLRLIRFSSTLGYAIDQDTKNAMKNRDIGEALNNMISRERVGTELDKMLKGPDPRMAFSMIHELDLYSIIFTDPIRAQIFEPDLSQWETTYDSLSTLIEQSAEYPSIASTSIASDDDKYISWVLAAFVPYADAPELSPNMKGGKPPPLLSVLAAKEGIKATNRICDILAASCRNAEDITAMKDDIVKALRHSTSANPAQAVGRDTLGIAIRHWGPSWPHQVMYALLLEVTRVEQGSRDIFQEYNTFLKHLAQLDLLSACDLKPIIDGKALAAALGTKPGPWMKDAIEIVMAWQLQNPSTATAEGAVEAIRAKSGELTSSLVQHFLRLTIRPLFSNSQTHNITAQARKRVETKSAQVRSAELPEEIGAKAWKDPKNSFALDLLSWTVNALNEKRTEENWPLLVPPLLALVDDVHTEYKRKGCAFLTSLFTHTAPTFLARTGLGKVFEEAVEPCLSYLPSLTPEDDSIKLLDAAYPCLIHLSDIRFPVVSQSRVDSRAPVYDLSSGPQGTKASDQRTVFLSKILHEHLIATILHVSDAYPRLATALLSQLELMMKALGMQTVGELIHVLPLLTNILRNPFAVRGHVALLSRSALALQTLISVAWPRIHKWRGEILMGISHCWINACESEDEHEAGATETRKFEPYEPFSQPTLEELKQNLRVCMKMLDHAVESSIQYHTGIEVEEQRAEDSIDWSAELDSLVSADSRTEPLVRYEHRRVAEP